MALNFGGLGFSFSATDKDGTKNTEDFRSSVNGLWEDLTRVATGSVAVGKKITTGFGAIASKGKGAFSSVSSMIGDIVSSAMDPKLDSALSSQFAQFDKSFSQLTAGMKLTEQESRRLKKVGSIALGLNEDMEAAAKSVLTFEKQGIDLVKVLGSNGLEGAMKDLTKATAVYGVEGEQLAIIMAGLVKGHGMSEERVGSLADKIVSIGKHFNIGTEAIQSWPSIFEAVDKAGADFGKKITTDEVENLTLSIVKMGAGLKESLGMTGQQGMEIARNMFDTMSKERMNIIDLFRGTGGELGDLAQRLMESGDDVQGVFDTMFSGDPIKMLEMFSNMATEAEKRGGDMGVAYQRLIAGLSAAGLDPSVLYAAQGAWGSVQKQMEQLPGVIAKSEGAFVRIANQAHKTGRSAQESWDFMIANMQAKMYQLSNKDIRQWTKTMSTGFSTTYGKVKALSEDAGPIGELTRKMLLASRVGVSAFLPSLGPIAPMLSNIASSALPVMTAMGSMGLRFGTLGKMLLPGAAIFAGFKLLREGPAKAMETLRGYGDGIQKHFGGTINTIVNMIKDIDFKMLFTNAIELIQQIPFGRIFDIGTKAAGALFESLQEALSKIPFDKIFDTASGAFSGLVNTLFGSLSKIDFGGIGGTIGRILHSLGSAIGSALQKIDWSTVLRGTFDFIGNIFSGVGEMFISIFAGGSEKKIIKGAKGFVQGPLKAGIGDAFIVVLKGLKTIALSFMKSVWSGLFSADSISDAVGKVVKVIIGGFAVMTIASKKFRGSMFSAFRDKGMIGGMKAFGKSFKGVMKSMKAALGPMALIMGAMEALEQAKVRAQNAAKIMADSTITEINKTTLAAEQGFTGILKTVDAMLMGIPSMIGESMGLSEDHVSGFYHSMVASAEKGIAYIANGFMLIPDIASAAAGLAVLKVTDAWNSILYKAEVMWDGLKAGWHTVVGGITLAISLIVSSVKDTFATMADHVLYPFERIGHELKKWASEFLEMMFGKKGQETAIARILKMTETGADIVKFGQEAGAEMQKAYSKAGGEDFYTDYWKQAEKRQADRDKAYTATMDAIRRGAKSDVGEAYGGIVEAGKRKKAVGSSVEQERMNILTGLGNKIRDTGYLLDQQSKQMDEQARRATEESRRFRQKENAASTVVSPEETGDNNTGTRRNKKNRNAAVTTPVPTESRYDQSADQSSYHSAMDHRIAALSNAMADFVKDPLQVKVVFTDRKLSKMLGNVETAYDRAVG